MRAKMRWVAMVGAVLLAAATSAQLGGGPGQEARPTGGGYGGGLGGRTGGAPDVGPVGTVWLAMGPVTVGEGEEISGLVALGPVTVAGTVAGDVTSIGGKVSLQKSAVVTGNITAICAPIEVAEGAKVAGEVRPDELPDMASIIVGWPGTEAAAVRIGETEIGAGEGAPKWLVVLGGNVTVPKGSQAGEIVAIGGDITVEEGAELKAARVIGGEIHRPEAKLSEQDEAMGGVVFPCLAEDRPDSPVSRSSQFRISQSTESMQFGLNSSGGSSARVDLSAKGEKGDLALSLAMDAVGRLPGRLPWRERYGGGEAPEYRPIWQSHYNQPGQATSHPQQVPHDSDPDFAKSAAVGVGLQLIVSATDEKDRRGERTVRIGIPGGAQTLLGAGGYAGGGFGGGYGRGDYGGGEGAYGGGRGGRDQP